MRRIQEHYADFSELLVHSNVIFENRTKWQKRNRKQQLLRGAEEACWAHNPKVVGSKPTAAIPFYVLKTRLSSLFVPSVLSVFPTTQVYSRDHEEHLSKSEVSYQQAEELNKYQISSASRLLNWVI